jgi:sugar lactone lactonase YvrE
MKNKILNLALVAIATCVACNGQAQPTRAIKGSYEISCTPNTNTSQTVLDGAWGITTDRAGNLVISDKNNNVVRMIEDGGTTVVADKSTPNSISNYPIGLTVDKCGNLHITDNTIYSTPNAPKPALLPIAINTTWGDPDMSAQTKPEAMAVAKNTK